MNGELSRRWLGLLVLSMALVGARASAQGPTVFPGDSGSDPFAEDDPLGQEAAAEGDPRGGDRGSGPPYLDADEHDCQTLFDAEDAGDQEGDEPDRRARLGPNEECFRDEQLRWRWQLSFFTGPTREATWDDSLAARGYGPSDVYFGGDTALLRLLGSHFALGARTSVRDLRWLHFERPPATVFGWDLMLASELRTAVGKKQIVSLGIDLSVGLGVAFSRLNDGRATDLGWRLQSDALLALRFLGPAAAVIRLGYDHFPVTIGGSLDAQLGGFRFTFGLEINE